MKKIEEYIKLPLVERQSHLRLDEPCVERGGNSSDFRGLVACLLDTTIPTKKMQIYLCHSCNNAKCGNPKHLYWGTPRENHDDKVRAGRWENPWIGARRKGKDVHKLAVAAGKRGAEATWNKIGM